ncbi:hypothetical protein DK847_03445 [Aestuariivirga litoralis]|uniref:DUF1007 domain-containing protein n=1 Tax=Aestuariivirga litoralis TaxID=2650924 RepID=A0A2W2BF68_9HYPH|nr:DUF1007 family protein [Aestuariivirga litoralis]PZF78858.1 hypothetical protein DK847_03445 [Aestuariivirga litoralis]
MRTARRAALAALAFASAAAATPASAHPHVWIQMQSGVVFNDQGQIAAVKLAWTFDDGYASLALDGLDKNGNGTYEPEELEPLTRENLESLKDYDFFTHVRLNGKAQALGAPTAAGQSYTGGKLQLHFELPLSTPVDPTRGEFVLKVYDPEFYIAFDYAGTTPVTVSGNMPPACKPVLKPLPTDAELEQTRAMLSTKGPDWKPDEEEDFGALFAQPMTIQCQA